MFMRMLRVLRVQTPDHPSAERGTNPLSRPASRSPEIAAGGFGLAVVGHYGQGQVPYGEAAVGDNREGLGVGIGKRSTQRSMFNHSTPLTRSDPTPPAPSARVDGGCRR